MSTENCYVFLYSSGTEIALEYRCVGECAQILVGARDVRTGARDVRPGARDVRPGARDVRTGARCVIICS